MKKFLSLVAFAFSFVSFAFAQQAPAPNAFFGSGAVNSVPKICSYNSGLNVYCPSNIGDNGTSITYNGSPITGTGTVTTFSFPSTLGALFTCSVATATTTPAVTCSVTNAAANSVYGNFTGSGAAPSFSTAPIFNGSGLTNLPFMSLTTTGSSGASTLIGGVLNIPQYSSGGSVTWPTTADLVISNSTSSPAGLAPINGDCVVGSGGAWTAGSCGGSGTPYPSGSGVPIVASGTSWGTTVAAPTGTIVGTSDTQTLTNKSIAGSEINSSLVANTYGGTGLNTSASSGVAQVSAGTWSVSNTLLNSLTATNMTLITPALGTPTAVILTNATGLPVGGMASVSANTVIGNGTGSSASPTALSMPSCSGATNALIWTSATGFGCNTISTSSVAWSGLTAPTGSLSLTVPNADLTTFTWGSATSTANFFTWTDTASNTGSGILGHFTTAASSTAIPWQADANGTGWKVNASGQLASTATGVSSAIGMSGATSGTVTQTVPSTAGTATVTWGNGTGTPAVTASAPLAINTTTGNLTITGAAGQILAGATPAFTATPTLGASGTLGSISFGNATSGTVTLGTVTGALGSVTASLPANTGTLAELNLAQTWSAVQTISASNGLVLSAMTGTTCLEQVSGVVTSTGSVCGSGGSLPTTTAGQTYFSSGTTGTATSGILIGATSGAISGAGLSIGGLEFGAAPVFFDGYAPTGAVTFSASCASGTTASCAINNSSSLLDPNGGVIWAGIGDGSNDGEWIKYGAATTTAITTLTRGYFGSTAATHGNTVPIQLLNNTWVQSTTTPPFLTMTQNGGIWIAPGNSTSSNNVGTGPGLYTGSTIYDIAGQLCFTAAGNGKDCMSINSAAINITNDSGNTTAGFGGNALQYSIATQTIATTATLTAITNAVTPVMRNNGSAAAAGTAGVLSSRCHIIWSQATGGTVSFGVKLSAAVTSLDVTETDFAGTGGIALGSFIAQGITTTTTTLTSSGASNAIVPATFGTVYYSDLTLTLNPGTTNSPTVALYAESSSSSDTLSLYKGTGCSAWQ